MAGRFAVLNFTALREFPSNIEPSTRKRKKQNEKKKRKGINRSKIEETKSTHAEKITDNAHCAHAASTAGLCPTNYSPPTVTPVLP